jgi:hypothetical protein
MVPGDDRGIDAADRNAGDGIGLQSGLVQCLIDTGLIGAQRAAALQDQGDVVAAVRVPGPVDRPIGGKWR